jgi:hypothetical protein
VENREASGQELELGLRGAVQVMNPGDKRCEADEDHRTGTRGPLRGGSRGVQGGSKCRGRILPEMVATRYTCDEGTEETVNACFSSIYLCTVVQRPSPFP